MKRYLIVIFCGAVFLHHVFCTVLHNAPVNPVSATYQNYVAAYMGPLFNQRWLLFAPDPAISDLKLWYRLKANNKWHSWLDPIEPILNKHQRLRFTYNAKLLYVYGNIPKELSLTNEILSAKYACKTTDAACQRVKEAELFGSAEFKLARKYVIQNALKSFPGLQVDSMQLMLIQLYPKQFSERQSNKPFGFANAIEFSPVAFKTESR